MNNIKEFNRGYFDKQAGLCPEYYSSSKIQPYELGIINNLQPNSKVLDLCCGGGRVSVELARRGHDVTGVDYSAEMCALARYKFMDDKLKGTFICADAINLPFADNIFDYVLCVGNSFNNFRKSDVALSFKEIARILKIGGQFYASVLRYPLYVRWHHIYTRIKNSLPAGYYAYKSVDSKQKGIALELGIKELSLWLNNAGLIGGVAKTKTHLIVYSVNI